MDLVEFRFVEGSQIESVNGRADISCDGCDLDRFMGLGARHTGSLAHSWRSASSRGTLHPEWLRAKVYIPWARLGAEIAPHGGLEYEEAGRIGRSGSRGCG